MPAGMIMIIIRVVVMIAELSTLRALPFTDFKLQTETSKSARRPEPEDLGSSRLGFREFNLQVGGQTDQEGWP